MKTKINSWSDMYNDPQNVIESRILHLEDMKRRPVFNGEFDAAREGERRLCEDEILYARFRIEYARISNNKNER